MPGIPQAVLVRRLASALLLTVLALGIRATPVASGPRPTPLIDSGLADPWRPPEPAADQRFTTLSYHAIDGREGTWVLSDRRLPLRVVIEREVVDRFGLAPVRDALTVWNDVAGSRFALEIVDVVDTDVDRKRRDGVSRVFMDRHDCDGDYLARAHLHPGQVVERDGRLTNYFWEADIGVCARLPAERLASVLRHEVGHVAGLGHLCDPGDRCWRAGTGRDNRCRVMFPAAYRCQRPTDGDELGLIHLYPRLPRLTTDTPQTGPAAASRLAFPRSRSANEAILVPERAAPRLRIEAAHLAGLRRVPILVVGDRCTRGAGGVELDRVLAVHAHVTLVGEVSGGCADELKHGWGLTVERQPDHVALVDAVRDELDGPRTAYVVSEDASALADLAVTVPAATRRGALLLRAGPDGLTPHAREVIEATPSLRHLIIVGRTAGMVHRVDAEALELRLASTRIVTSDTAALSLRFASDRAVAGSIPNQFVLTSTLPRGLVTAAVLGASQGWPALLTPSDVLDARIATRLRDGAIGGVVAGDERVLSPAIQVQASRAIG